MLCGIERSDDVYLRLRHAKFCRCRYLFALQVKRDLLTGTMPCQDHTAVLLASYIVQCKLGLSFRRLNNRDDDVCRRHQEPLIVAISERNYICSSSTYSDNISSVGYFANKCQTCIKYSRNKCKYVRGHNNCKPAMHFH